MIKVRFVISNELLKEALHIPQDCKIDSVNVYGQFDDLQIIAWVPGEVGELDIPKILDINPIIHYQPETYTLDWNLPKDVK